MTKPLRFAIIGGHGGRDRSNRGADGYVEADWALNTAIALTNALNRHEEFFAANLRPVDMSMSINTRIEKAIAMSADIVIDLHTNAGGGRGTENFISIHRPQDKAVSDRIAQKTAEHFGTVNRGTKHNVLTSGRRKGDDLFGILRLANDNGMMGLITETLFHDNAREVGLLNDPQSSIDAAEIIAWAFCVEHGVDYISCTEEEMRREREEMERINNAPPSKWAEPYVNASKALGLSDGTRPLVGLTREEGITLNLRAYRQALLAFKEGRIDEALAELDKYLEDK